MSLVRLAAVASHLQNASLARLGLTSIPYSKLHLSLALLLQKEGFFSQVKLGGPAPPASCFPAGVVDLPPTYHNEPSNPDAALLYKVRHAASRDDLKSRGFTNDAIEFAELNAYRSYEELVEAGFLQRTQRLVRQYRQAAAAAKADRERAEAERRDVERRERVAAGLESEEEQTPAEPAQPAEDVSLGAVSGFSEDMQARLRPALAEVEGIKGDREILDFPFSHQALVAVAGQEAALRSEHDLARHGITHEVMGLPVREAAITHHDAPPDPLQLDAEGVVTQANIASRRLWLGLKYAADSRPVLSTARLISKPTKRIWLSHRDLANVIRGRPAGEVKGMTQIGEVMVVSTDRGIMEARDCVERRIGGQPLLRVW